MGKIGVAKMVTFLGLKVKEAHILDSYFDLPRQAYIVFEGGQTAMVDAKNLLINATIEAVDINLSNGRRVRIS